MTSQHDKPSWCITERIVRQRILAKAENPGTEINEAGEFDRLYIVTADPSGRASTVLMRYGKPFEEAGAE